MFNMKNLFTLCACALFSLTLSAQSEQAAGSFYLGTGDALDLVNIFGGEIEMTATIGYAVIDDLVVSGSINSATDCQCVDACGASVDHSGDIDLDLSARYFWKGIFFQAGAENLLGAHEDDMSISLGVGKYFQLNALNDRFYIDPQINYNLDDGFNTMIGLGLRF